MSGARSENNATIPYIVVPKVQNVGRLVRLAETEVGEDGFYTRPDEIRFVCTTMEKHEALLKLRSRLHKDTYTEEIQQEPQNYKVTIKGLHPNTHPKWILPRLAQLGHKVIAISNIRAHTTQRRTSTYSVELKVKENNQDILNVNQIGNRQVSITKATPINESINQGGRLQIHQQPSHNKMAKFQTHRRQMRQLWRRSQYLMDRMLHMYTKRHCKNYVKTPTHPRNRQHHHYHHHHLNHHHFHHQNAAQQRTDEANRNEDQTENNIEL
nr:uncharacterized protein LOC116650165 [Drosophila virilis]